MEATVALPQSVENEGPKKENFFQRLVGGLLRRNKQALDARRKYALGEKNPAENAKQEAAVNPSETQKPAAASESKPVSNSSSIDQRGIGY